MKKFSLLIFFLIGVLISNAQRTGLWAEGGVTFATQIQSLKGDGSRSSITGPYIGIFVRDEYPTLLGWEIGAYYTQKGTRMSDSGYSVGLDYLGAYIDGYLSFPLVHNSVFFFGPGIYVGSAFQGAVRTDSSKYAVPFGEQWEKLDLGVEFKTGYTYNNFITISAKYGIGINRNYTSKYPAQRGEYNKGRNSAFSITAGIKLAKLRGTNTLRR